MKDDLAILKFESFSFVNMPAGAHLFFPALDERPQRRDRHPAEIRSVVILAVDDQELPRELGLASPRALHVRLDRDHVEAIRKELKGRDLTNYPVVFEYRLEGELLKVLRRNGEPIVCSTERRDSGIEALKKTAV
jgi:hypothetical protein